MNTGMNSPGIQVPDPTVEQDIKPRILTNGMIATADSDTNRSPDIKPSLPANGAVLTSKTDGNTMLQF